jgi:UPF0716 protein FxsA
MLFRLFLAFTLIPVAELYILIKIGSVIGSLNTILLIILTGLAGAHLAREQGMQTMMKVRMSLNQGVMPTEELTDALIILVAGIVLLTPGLITDVAGLLLLFPPTRRRLKAFVKDFFERNIQAGTIDITRYP